MAQIVDTNYEQNNFIVDNPTLTYGSISVVDPETNETTSSMQWSPTNSVSNEQNMPAYVAIENSAGIGVPPITNGLWGVESPFVAKSPIFNSMFGIQVINKPFKFQDLVAVLPAVNMPKLQASDNEIGTYDNINGLVSGCVLNGCKDTLSVTLNGDAIPFDNCGDEGLTNPETKRIIYSEDYSLYGVHQPDRDSDETRQYIQIGSGTQQLAASDGYGEDIEYDLPMYSVIQSIQYNASTKQLTIWKNTSQLRNIKILAFGYNSTQSLTVGEPVQGWQEINDNGVIGDPIVNTYEIKIYKNNVPGTHRKVNITVNRVLYKLGSDNNIQCYLSTYFIPNSAPNENSERLLDYIENYKDTLKVKNITLYPDQSYPYNFLYKVMCGSTSAMDNDEYEYRTDMGPNNAYQNVYYFPTYDIDGIHFVGYTGKTVTLNGTSTKVRFNISTHKFEKWVTSSSGRPIQNTSGNEDKLLHPQDDLTNVTKLLKLDFDNCGYSNVVQSDSSNLIPDSVINQSGVNTMARPVTTQIDFQNISYDTVFIVARRYDTNNICKTIEYTPKISLKTPVLKIIDGKVGVKQTVNNLVAHTYATYIGNYPFVITAYNSNNEFIETVSFNPKAASDSDISSGYYLMPFTNAGAVNTGNKFSITDCSNLTINNLQLT